MKCTFKFLFLLVAVSCATPTLAQQKADDTHIRNVILMIGDGMGLAQVGSLMIEENYAPTAFDRAQYIGLSKTYSANNRVTDSAAAGTAMATGHKTNNGYISMSPEGEPLPTLAELAEAKGLATALVVTSHLADATPSVFAAHALNRHDSKTITAGYADAGIDILAGGGREYFEESLDDRNIIEELKGKGYRYVSTPEEFLATDATPLLGLFADESMPLADKRGEQYLTDMTVHTLDLLSRAPNGFFAMIEGSEIDGAGHENDTELLHAEMRDFNNAVNAAFDFADKHPGTLVIAVADHETGGLTMISNNRDFTAGESGIEYKFSTTSHSATPVVLYAYGAGAEHFSGVMENTDIFRRIKALLID